MVKIKYTKWYCFIVPLYITQMYMFMSHLLYKFTYRKNVDEYDTRQIELRSVDQVIISYDSNIICRKVYKSIIISRLIDTNTSDCLILVREL